MLSAARLHPDPPDSQVGGEGQQLGAGTSLTYDHCFVESGWYDEGREGTPTMNLTLPLTPVEEAKLLAKAREAGTTPEQVVRQAIEPILGSIPEHVPPVKTAKKSLLGIWSQYGPGPSEEEIDQNRAEMFSAFGRDDIA